MYMYLPRGEDHVSSKLTNESVRDIRSNPDNLSTTELADRFHVKPRTIRDVKMYVTWFHVK